MKWAAAALVATACSSDGGPRLETATPDSAAAGAMVAITGVRLCGPTHDCMTAGGHVLFGYDPPQIEASIVSYTDTTAVVLVPPAAAAGDTSIVVTVNDQASNALAFEVVN